MDYFRMGEDKRESESSYDHHSGDKATHVDRSGLNRLIGEIVSTTM